MNTQDPNKVADNARAEPKDLKRSGSAAKFKAGQVSVADWVKRTSQEQGYTSFPSCSRCSSPELTIRCIPEGGPLAGLKVVSPANSPIISAASFSSMGFGSLGNDSQVPDLSTLNSAQ
jgi:hypothetical protein